MGYARTAVRASARPGGICGSFSHRAGHRVSTDSQVAAGRALEVPYMVPLSSRCRKLLDRARANPAGLRFRVKGNAKPYQVRQLLKAIEEMEAG